MVRIQMCLCGEEELLVFRHAELVSASHEIPKQVRNDLTIKKTTTPTTNQFLVLY